MDLTSLKKEKQCVDDDHLSCNKLLRWAELKMSGNQQLMNVDY